MSRSINKKTSADLLDLEARFLEGERLTKEQIALEYFNPKNMLDGLYARDAAENYLNRLKNVFTKSHNVWFGNLNEMGQFGIPASKAEFNYILNKYRVRVMGSIKRTFQVYDDGVAKKMIEPVQNTQLLLPVLPEEEIQEK